LARTLVDFVRFVTPLENLVVVGVDAFWIEARVEPPTVVGVGESS